LTERRGGFSTRDALTLAKRAAFLCTKPACRISTVGPTEDPEGSKSIGEAAHIRGNRPASARYDPQQTPQDRSSISNGIWLCRNHAKEVDNDAIAFPVELLEQWKKDHDSYVDEIFGERQRIFENTCSSAQETLQIRERLDELAVMMKQQLVVSHRISAAMPWTNAPTGVGPGPLVSRARIAANGFTLLDDGENVLSIGDGGAGLRSITWDQDYANTEYDVFLTVDRKGCQAVIVEQSVSGVVIQIYERDEWPQDAELRVYAVGDVMLAEAVGNQSALHVGEWEVIKFDREIRDPDVSFDGEVFNIAHSGLFQFDVDVGFLTWDDAASEYELALVTSNRTYEQRYSAANFVAMMPITLRIPADMDASDTAYFQIRQTGGQEGAVIKAGSYLKVQRIGD